MTERRHWAALRRRLAPGAGRHPWAARLARALRLGAWFPHVPLALAICLAGLVQFVPHFGSLRRLVAQGMVPANGIGELSKDFTTLAIHGVPQEVVGGLLVLLSLGLLVHSRLAWVLTLLLTVGSIGLPLLASGVLVTAASAFSIGLLVALLLARNSFRHSNLAVGTLFALVGVLVTLGYGVLGSYALGKGFSPPITDFVQAIYFSVITMSTVGYGDITPKTDDAQLFTISLVSFGLVVFATSLTTIVGPVINNRITALLAPRRKHMTRSNHIIVAGSNPLARNVVKLLAGRGVPVTAICARAPEAEVEAPEDLIVGDATNSEVLESAGVGQARAVLALLDNDADNAFVVLAAKDANPALKTLLAVNDAHNMDRMRRVKPDAVLALPVVGAELVAMALSGEEIRTDKLLEQLLKLR